MIDVNERPGDAGEDTALPEELLEQVCGGEGVMIDPNGAPRSRL